LDLFFILPAVDAEFIGEGMEEGLGDGFGFLGEMDFQGIVDGELAFGGKAQSAAFGVFVDDLFFDIIEVFEEFQLFKAVFFVEFDELFQSIGQGFVEVGVFVEVDLDGVFDTVDAFEAFGIGSEAFADFFDEFFALDDETSVIAFPEFLQGFTSFNFS